jgi:hypothetical protein
VDRRSYAGDWTLARMNELGGEIAAKPADWCETWEDTHG